jgi:autotransporter-associated beta strand protein
MLVEQVGSATVATTGTGTGAITIGAGAAFTLYGSLNGAVANNGTMNYYTADASSQSIVNGISGAASNAVLNFAGSSANYSGNITNGVSSANTGAIVFLSPNAATGATINNQYGYIDIANAMTNVALSELYGSGSVYLGNNSLILNNGSNQTISGVIQDGAAAGGGGVGGSLIYAGTSGSQLTLSENNTYTGTTTIISGIVNLTGGLSSSSKLINNDTFKMNNGDVSLAGLSGSNNAAVIAMNSNNLNITGGAGMYTGNFSGSGGLNYSSSGMLTLNNSAVLGYSGNTTISNGILQIGTAAVTTTGTGTGAITINSGATLTLYGSLNAAVTNNGTMNYYTSAASNKSIINGVSGAPSNAILNFANGSANYSGNITNGVSSTNTGAIILYSPNVVTGASINNQYGYFDISNVAGNVALSNLYGSGSVYLGSNTLTLNNGSNQTISGAIRDGSAAGGGGIGGSLIYAGAAGSELVLAANNTYTGMTTVSSGAISVTGSLAGITQVNNGATVDVYGTLAKTLINYGTANYHNALGGSSPIINNNLLYYETGASAGNAVITNGNGTTYNGTIVFSGNTTAGTATITNHEGSQIEFQNGSTAGMATIINDSNHYFRNDSSAGTSTLINNDNLHFMDNSTAGTANITNNNIISFNDQSNAGATYIINTNSMYFNNQSTAMQTQIVSINDVFDISGHSAPSITIGSLSGSANIYLGNNEIRLGALGLNDTLSGSIHDGTSLVGIQSIGGGSLTKVGTGTLVIDSIASYTGTTTVEQGTLILGDISHPQASVLGPTIVDVGANLFGFGTVDNTLTNDGTFSAGLGTAIGTFHVTGDYIQGSNAQYLVNIEDNMSNLLVVNGQAVLNNGTAVINSVGTRFNLNHAYTVLIAEGGVFGEFSLGGQPTFISLGLVYEPQTVEYVLTFNKPAINQALETPNQISVSNFILESENIPNVNGVLGNLDTGSELRNFLDQFSGATYADQQVALLLASQHYENQIADKLDRHNICYSQESIVCERDLIWVQTFAGKSQINDTRLVSGLKMDDSGVGVGVELPTNSEGALGLGFGYNKFNMHAAGVEIASAKGNLYQTGIYGFQGWNHWRLGGAFDFGFTNSIAAKRNIITPFSKEEITANYTSTLTTGQLRLSYEFLFQSAISMRPVIGGIYQRVRGNDFRENSDTGFELHIDEENYKSIRSDLGLRLEALLPGNVIPNLYVAWEHNYAKYLIPEINMQMIGYEIPFIIEGTEFGRNAFLIESGVDVTQCKNWNLRLLYQGRFALNENGNYIRVEVGY